MNQLLNEIGREYTQGYQFPPAEVPLFPSLPKDLQREDSLELPSLSELEVVRHFTNLAMDTFSVDQGMYPLGSCTMKYNPKIHEELVNNSLFTAIHPLQDQSTIQGSLEIMYSLLERLCSIVGMDWGTLQSAGGAQGEYIGLHLIKSFHQSRGDFKRNTVLIPSNAHGTNPASAAFCSMNVVEIPVDGKGLVDIKALEPLMDDTIAAIMLTNPNTLGSFEVEIAKIASMVHECGGLLYYDGANLNAIMEIVKPGDMGFDVMHVNVHKTFSTPHGGGGPGAGPVLVKEFLRPFLPVPDIVRTGDTYSLSFDREQSIGKTLGFWGNFPILLRAYAYILTLGDSGLRWSSMIATLNANYIKARLEGVIPLGYQTKSLHEIVLSFKQLKDDYDTTSFDVAKALIDKGFHPPTIYFPLIVHEAMMIEPTESESLARLDEFVDALLSIVQSVKDSPTTFKGAPYTTKISRVDEVTAARRPIVNWRESSS
jgi:glycine dehydrogenase subunit 2